MGNADGRSGLIVGHRPITYGLCTYSTVDSIWFWSRLDIPPALTAAVAGTGPIDLKTWGPPSAAYMATGCNVTEFFSPQQLVRLISHSSYRRSRTDLAKVLDITLCGDWAGEPHNYNLTCGAGLCYEDNVPGNGANYDEAYFEVRGRVRTMPPVK
jgi:hypothetical protein